MKILIPIDGSQISGYTVEWACRAFNQAENEFYLLSVITDPMTVEYQLEDADTALRLAREQMERCGLRVAKAEFMTGDPVERICEYANDVGADQVLMGSHGRTGLMKRLLGSVSQGVLERCDIPVFIYRHHLGALAGNQR